MTERIGSLRHRVRLESPQRTEDDIGGAALSWVNEGEAWAAVIAVGVSRSAAFDASPTTSSYTIVVNRRDDARPGWRVVWSARSLRIVGMRDDGGPRIELFCEEEAL